jgi:hypothetical protein
MPAQGSAPPPAGAVVVAPPYVVPPVLEPSDFISVAVPDVLFVGVVFAFFLLQPISATAITNVATMIFIVGNSF